MRNVKNIDFSDSCRCSVIINDFKRHVLIRAPKQMFASFIAPTKRATKYRVMKCQMCEVHVYAEV
jgi:hypothetical protein